jgi:acetyl esterase/lipase
MKPRLVPQNTLPTVILDALVGYFYLTAPPPSATHKPVPPSTLILAGESGGATLHLAILQFLQYYLPQDPTIRIFNQSAPLVKPRGCALISPPMDLPFALPAASTNGAVDWMPERAPWFNDDFPADHIWPSSPPRAETFVDASAILHPLIQPTLCPESGWKGMPPMWIACGQERYADGIKYFVRAVRRAGVAVRFQEYRGMVHSFCVLMPWMKQSRDCVKEWGKACREMVESGDSWVSWAGSVEMGELRRKEVGFEDLIRLEEQDVRRKMEAGRDTLMKMVWRGPKVVQAKM